MSKRLHFRMRLDGIKSDRQDLRDALSLAKTFRADTTNSRAAGGWLDIFVIPGPDIDETRDAFEQWRTEAGLPSPDFVGLVETPNTF